jgi:hypothetical protein
VKQLEFVSLGQARLHPEPNATSLFVAAHVAAHVAIHFVRPTLSVDQRLASELEQQSCAVGSSQRSPVMFPSVWLDGLTADALTLAPVARVAAKTREGETDRLDRNPLSIYQAPLYWPAGVLD